MLLSIKRNENSKSTYPRAFKDALPQQRESSLKQYGSMRRLMNSEYLSKASKAPEEWKEILSGGSEVLPQSMLLYSVEVIS